MTDHDNQADNGAMNELIRGRRPRPRLRPEQAAGSLPEPDASRDNERTMAELIRSHGNRRRLTQTAGEEPVGINELIRRRRRG